MGDWQRAIHHALQIHDWPAVVRLLTGGKDHRLADSALFVKNTLESFSSGSVPGRLASDNAPGERADPVGRSRRRLSSLSRSAGAKGSGAVDGIAGYRRMAETLADRKEYGQAINQLRSALNLIGQEANASETYQKTPQGLPRTDFAALPLPESGATPFQRLRSWHGLLGSSSTGKWFGATLGLAVGSFLWFGQPDIGLDSTATKLLGLISGTLIFWVFRALPDYGVALIFAMIVILTKLESAQTVMGGFASTTWFMTLGVLGLGAAITGSGLFYRLSLHLVRMFPLSYYWQIVATGIMGIVVMALIPQQTARTVITSQMLVNLSESLGYKTPSRASTGLFVASFLGLGQLGFLFLTGSTTSLIAWGLLPSDVRAQFTWGYWFLAALPPTLIVIAIILVCTILLYRPESQPKISYTMVQTQLDILGPLSHKEWISFAVLCFTVAGWLTAASHGIDGAWIAIIAFRS